MKLFSAVQIQALDKETINAQQLASIDLMERAASAFAGYFIKKFPQTNKPIFIFCGTGNNGGDGLAIARILYTQNYTVQVYMCGDPDKRSADNALNYERLPQRDHIVHGYLHGSTPFPDVPDYSIVVDALFGTGLSRPLEGFWESLIEHLNQNDAIRVSVDIPSGLYADQNPEGVAFDADYTCTLGTMKRCFYHPESMAYCGEVDLAPIGLSTQAITDMAVDFETNDIAGIRGIIKQRSPFGHKGNYGHSLLICGSHGSLGAALLAGRASLRAGAGLLTLHLPHCGYVIAQTALPEAMVSLDRNEHTFSTVPDLESYDAVGVGCGLGKYKKTRDGLNDLMSKVEMPLVLDADALNIIAEEQWLDRIPKHSIITPHPGEFVRLFGESENSYKQVDTAVEMAVNHEIVIVLKGHHSVICLPTGHAYYNETGNPGMATAGSGDVLTGVITALLGQGYNVYEAARLGVLVHGLSGDLALGEESVESLIASDIIDYLGVAFHLINEA